MSRACQTSPNSLVAKTLWRIETELARGPSLGFLAAEECVSPFHLTRAFALATGRPVMAYVRARRLTEAARRLHGTGDTILSIALDAGYESHEGFTRAFRDMFGCTPKTARMTLPQNLQEPISMPPEAIPAPETKLVDFPGRRILGRSRRYRTDDRARVPAQWHDTLGELGEHMYGAESYGVCHGIDGEAFDYLVGTADDGRTDAEGLDQVVIKPGRYAVFNHAGHVSSIGQTWAAIFDQWLPESGLEVGAGPEFELYEAGFDPAKPGGVEVWIPVRQGGKGA